MGKRGHGVRLLDGTVVLTVSVPRRELSLSTSAVQVAFISNGTVTDLYHHAKTYLTMTVFVYRQPTPPNSFCTAIIIIVIAKYNLFLLKYV